MSIPHTSYSTQELQKRYQYLQGIDIPSISSSDITVSIGADMPQLLIHEEYKAGKKNEPYAVRTKLGWALMGSKSIQLEKSVMNNVCLVHSIDEINLEQIWNIENYGILSNNDPKMLTRDETQAINILETTTTLKNKHYEIGLL